MAEEETEPAVAEREFVLELQTCALESNVSSTALLTTSKRLLGVAVVEKQLLPRSMVVGERQAALLILLQLQ